MYVITKQKEKLGTQIKCTNVKIIIMFHIPVIYRMK